MGNYFSNKMPVNKNDEIALDTLYKWYKKLLLLQSIFEDYNDMEYPYCNYDKEKYKKYEMLKNIFSKEINVLQEKIIELENSIINTLYKMEEVYENELLPKYQKEAEETLLNRKG